MEGRPTAEDGKLVIGVGLAGGRRSKDILMWAMNKFLPEGNVIFKLLHVYPKLRAIPSPLGGWLPIAQAEEDLAARFRQEIEWKKNKLLLPYKKLLQANKVKADIVVLESDDIAMAISFGVTRLAIRHLVIGVSSSTWGISWKSLTIKTGRNNLPACISEAAPSSCSVYAIAAGKLEHLRIADSKQEVITINDSSRFSRTSIYASSNYSSFSLGSSISISQPREPEFRLKEKVTSKRMSRDYMEVKHTCPHIDLNFSQSSVTSQSSMSGYSESLFSTYSGGSFVSASTQDRSFASSFVGNPITATPSPYQSTADSQTGASQTQLSKLSKRLEEEAATLRERKPITTEEEIKPKSAQTEASVSGDNAETDISEKKAATKAPQEAEGNRKLQQQQSPICQNQKFTLKEIMEATSDFSDEFKIREGAVGTVYKCKLRHTTVAIKMLHSRNVAKNRQLLQELEILCKIRHPHLMLLLGVIPEEGCLVYEYMENGSLEDRLFRKDNRPLSWYDRFRICWEVARALAFLHSTKPTPIIHRDLKPANILLGQNMVSKIGDVSLGTMIDWEPTNSKRTMYKKTSLVGTLGYIDPEYQRTGRVSTKSDVYALGIVMLQLLTAKSASGIAYLVEEAIDEDKLMELLDKEAGNWPKKEALELASLAVQCAELRGRDRPDLKETVLPALESLKKAADNARERDSSGPEALPAHFICPISKDVMEDPYVAADGYTYNRFAIEQWLEENDTSPITNLPLPHTFIMPNFTMLEAIKQWKSKHRSK